MRHIDLGALQFPVGWEDRAKHALDEIEAKDEADRPAAITSRSAIWGDLKPYLENLSNKKCWYCESKEVRSDKHVDHFRPKNRVGEDGCGDHPGYWWLAFDWHNLRYCCTYCNCRRHDVETGTTGGKADRFPVKDETRRCRSPEQSLCDEQPVLLDPTQVADPGHLWFDEDGTPMPRWAKEVAPWPFQRADVSIRIYHLDHSNLKEARQAVCLQCKRFVAIGDQSWKEYASGSAVGGDQFRRVIRQLMDFVDGAAEYSAAARCTLMGLRGSNRPWLDSLLGQS
jgi:uncharacterized protein (TIGR02646 family)